jgi:hypothetical protein
VKLTQARVNLEFPCIDNFDLGAGLFQPASSIPSKNGTRMRAVLPIPILGLPFIATTFIAASEFHVSKSP